MKRLIGLKWECVCTFQPAQMGNHSCYANASVSLRNALLIHPPAASLILATSARWNSVTHRERWSTVLKVNILILCRIMLKFLLERNHPGLKEKSCQLQLLAVYSRRCVFLENGFSEESFFFQSYLIAISYISVYVFI